MSNDGSGLLEVIGSFLTAAGVFYGALQFRLAARQHEAAEQWKRIAASPAGVVKGRGVPLSQLTFGLLIFPGVWDWYLQWREQRRGFYTKWEEDMLMVAQALTRSEVGWIRQHPELLKNVRPIDGLIALEEIEFASRDWHGACDLFHRHAANRSKEIQRVMRVHRDPFEPIMCVLEADSPLVEYRKITDEILNRTPDEDRYPRAAAEAVRSFLLLRLGLHLGLRQKIFPSSASARVITSRHRNDASKT